MSNKLKIKFLRVDNIVLMKVLELPENIKEEVGKSAFSFNNITLKFGSHNHLTPDIIGVKATEPFFDKYCLNQFSSSFEAKRYINMYISCISAYNAILENKQKFYIVTCDEFEDVEEIIAGVNKDEDVKEQV